MTALNLAFSASIEVAISGNPDDPLTLEMLRTINRSPELDLPIVLRPNEGSSEIFDIAPFTRNLLPLNGKTTAYLCQTGKCKMPINEPEELSNKLEILSRGSRS